MMMPATSTVTAVSKPTHATVLGNLIMLNSFLKPVLMFLSLSLPRVPGSGKSYIHLSKNSVKCLTSSYMFKTNYLAALI